MSTSTDEQQQQQQQQQKLQKERDEAAAQLEHILSTSRPKNLAQGLGSGVGNVVAGAVGGAGVAVLLPAAGLAAGLRSGGLLGAALGVTGGAVAGILGGAALAVSGAVTGAVQIGRGLAAVPASVVAPRQGKWWNEGTGQWVRTDLPREAKALEGVPDDDDDILGRVQQEIDASVDFTVAAAGQVKDMAYYDCLEIPATAEPAVIKRKYYLLARQYHPDKHPGDAAAADKFKDVAEAYQVLSDPELRQKYDRDGKDGLSADKTAVAGGANPNLDPALLFAFLFGSDQFHDYIGRLSTATSASVGDSPQISLKQAQALQKRRVTRLAVKLAAKIAPWVEEEEASGADHGATEAAWRAEAIELSQASFGYQLVTTIGKIYNLVAITYQGSMDSGQGLPSISRWAAMNKAKMDKNRSARKNKMEAMKAGMDMMKMQAEANQKMQAAKTDEERQQIQADLQKRAAEVMLRVLWTTTTVDITAALHETTQMVFFDRSVDKDVRKHRAAAVRQLGQIWMDTPEPETDASEEAKDAQQLYEEAAFAAMLETLKRKDEAGQSAAPPSGGDDDA